MEFDPVTLAPDPMFLSEGFAVSKSPLQSAVSLPYFSQLSNFHSPLRLILWLCPPFSSVIAFAYLFNHSFIHSFIHSANIY